VEEFVGIKGRRAGGSYAGGKVVIPYLAGLCQHPSLVRGERGVLLCVAADQRQADVILDYADASFRASPVLSQLIEARTQREHRLNNGIDIEVRAADYRRLRGLTFIAVIADEAAAARAKWYARMRELTGGEAAQLEHERRRELTATAGKLAAQSPNHMSRRRVRSASARRGRR
jgi:hypothetical protein